MSFGDLNVLPVEIIHNNRIDILKLIDSYIDKQNNHAVTAIVWDCVDMIKYMANSYYNMDGVIEMAGSKADPDLFEEVVKIITDSECAIDNGHELMITEAFDNAKDMSKFTPEQQRAAENICIKGYDEVISNGYRPCMPYRLRVLELLKDRGIKVPDISRI